MSYLQNVCDLEKEDKSGGACLTAGNATITLKSLRFAVHLMQEIRRPQLFLYFLKK